MLFFFKQKTAYEIGVRLVGSEMCIRDRGRASSNLGGPSQLCGALSGLHSESCLLYTSDAADEVGCVDLGGRRIIKKS